MLASRSTIPRPLVSDAYVCFACRVRNQQQRRQYARLPKTSAQFVSDGGEEPSIKDGTASKSQQNKSLRWLKYKSTRRQTISKGGAEPTLGGSCAIETKSVSSSGQFSGGDQGRPPIDGPAFSRLREKSGFRTIQISSVHKTDTQRQTSDREIALRRQSVVAQANDNIFTELDERKRRLLFDPPKSRSTPRKSTKVHDGSRTITLNDNTVSEGATESLVESHCLGYTRSRRLNPSATDGSLPEFESPDCSWRQGLHKRGLRSNNSTNFKYADRDGVEHDCSKIEQRARPGRDSSQALRDDLWQSARQTLANLEAAAERSITSNRLPSDVLAANVENTTQTPRSSKLNSLPISRLLWQSKSVSNVPRRPHIRAYHASTGSTQATAAAAALQDEFEAQIMSREAVNRMTDNPNGIRAQLRKWNDLHGHEDATADIIVKEDVADAETPLNNLTRLPNELSVHPKSNQDEEEREAFSYFAEAGGDDVDGSARVSNRFFKMGDLVELSFKGERESVLAVFVRDVPTGANEAQFFTMTGRWIHVSINVAQYSIPGWVLPKLVEPLLDHLPSPDEVRDLDSLKNRAYVEDLSVPRDVAAPLVKRMVDFYNESQEIYRRYATTLDDAHNILAHDTDLRYGSLVSAATTLLNLPSEKLPLTALFTVRKALTNAGFAFSMDRRSHRLTGYMQIRSKDQVKMVETVRTWIRYWQDDLASRAGKTEQELARSRPSRGAQIVHGFVEKAKTIVHRSRENRQPTAVNNVGPSKVRIPLNNHGEVVRTTTRLEFTPEEQEIVRFMEAWCCSNTFEGLSQIQSLPPLLLQATGLYDSEMLSTATGFMFMQELGTIMPYDNRIRFDQHLLLPSSQHSKPLQNLMNSLIKMKDSHNFEDSMASLRYDWKQLPVYCIDDAGAQEIDDGISIEPAGTDKNGSVLHWVHIHIANPTAFFSREHPLAKMARHMGETIYFPERTYMMLPRWASQRHFSLAPNRPCLTFSVKLDNDGKTLEHKITPGTIHNVKRITPQELRRWLGVGSGDAAAELILRVGGDGASPRGRHVPVSLNESEVSDLHKLERLAVKRADIRKRAGGVFFNSEIPEVTVWQNSKLSGLAWDHPYRKGSRTVEGDPLIEMRTRGLRNWFAPDEYTVDALVRECMLLACEIAASWCAERQIPTVYRGTAHNPTAPDPMRYFRKVVEPATRPDGSYPMHIGLEYIQTIGQTMLTTKPKRHDMMGMQYYSKATSPLRRYGDMILHWQIEAALRHEAETGQSLVAAADAKVDRSFLPFSEPVLETIMLGLQPRERIISRSKMNSVVFWQAMLMFRKHHFAEDGALPFSGPGTLADGTNGLRPLRAFVSSSPEKYSATDGVLGILIELNMAGSIQNPTWFGMPEARRGDIWEVQVEKIDVYHRKILVKPVRLIAREGGGIL